MVSSRRSPLCPGDNGRNVDDGVGDGDDDGNGDGVGVGDDDSYIGA